MKVPPCLRELWHLSPLGGLLGTLFRYADYLINTSRKSWHSALPPPLVSSSVDEAHCWFFCFSDASCSSVSPSDTPVRSSGSGCRCRAMLCHVAAFFIDSFLDLQFFQQHDQDSAATRAYLTFLCELPACNVDFLKGIRHQKLRYLKPDWRIFHLSQGDFFWISWRSSFLLWTLIICKMMHFKFTQKWIA